MIGTLKVVTRSTSHMITLTFYTTPHSTCLFIETNRLNLKFTFKKYKKDSKELKKKCESQALTLPTCKMYYGMESVRRPGVEVRADVQEEEERMAPAYSHTIDICNSGRVTQREEEIFLMDSTEYLNIHR